MNLQQAFPILVAVAIMLLVGFPVHEFSHALAAYRQGDRTAQYMGRLTLDPRVHFDPLGGFLLIISAFTGFFIGWAKPTPYNPTNLSGGRRGEAIVAAAGPLSNLALAVLGAICVRVIVAVPILYQVAATTSAGSFIFVVLQWFVVINVFLLVFNLLPIPVIGLDGWKVLLGLVDPMTAFRLRQVEMQYQQYILLGLVVLLLFGGAIIGPITNAILSVLLG